MGRACIEFNFRYPEATLESLTLELPPIRSGLYKEGFHPS